MSLPDLLPPRLLSLGFILFFLLLILLFMILGRGRPSRTLRPIPAFQRLKRAVSLSVEAGQRLHVTLGWGGVSGLPGAAGLVGLNVLQRIMRIAAVADHPPVATSGDGLLGVLSQDVLRNASRAGGAPGDVPGANGQVSGLTPFSYAAGVIPLVSAGQDEPAQPAIAATFLGGHFGSEAALITEASERSGSLTVAGSDSLAAQAVLYAAATEPLIGEELFAGGAYLQAGSAHTASLRAQDVLRWLLIAGILAGAALKLAGVL